MEEIEVEDTTTRGDTTPLAVPPARAFARKRSSLDDSSEEDSGSSSNSESIDSQGRPRVFRRRDSTDAARAAHYVKKYDRRQAKGIREDALKVLNKAEGRHVPRALSGLGLTGTSDRSLNTGKNGRVSRRYKDNDDASHHSGSSSSANTEDLIDVVRLQNRAATARALLEADDVVEDEELLANSNNKSPSWSSRYSVDRTLLALTGAGGVDAKAAALGRPKGHDLDRESGSGSRSARNMFASSAHTVKSMLGKSGDSVDDKPGRRAFGSGFKFRNSSSKGLLPNGDHEAWRSYDAEGRDFNDDYDRTNNDAVGHSLPVSASSSIKPWSERQRAHRQRRRRCIIIVVLILLAIAAGIIGGLLARRKNSTTATSVESSEVSNGGNSPTSSGSDNGTGAGSGVGSKVAFYVTSGPVEGPNGEPQLLTGLKGLPSDTQFIIHLGDLQDPSSSCPADNYSKAAVVIQQSPAPTFVLPGEEDWIRCPSPLDSWNFWKNAFVSVENYYAKKSLTVQRQRIRPENFAILHKGVLFMGLHIVDGPGFANDAWNALESDINNFVFGMLNTHASKYRAVVILANARPGIEQQDFFIGLRQRADELQVPVAYVHASNKGSNAELKEYDLFSDISDNNLARKGIQIRDNYPVSEPEGLLQRITVAFGNDPFVLG